ncbi:radical SAM/SPASM domain-containing protein [Aliarcobacter thereius]|uniref:Molybdenum cofactor biosynthesis protein A n=1 Tax=Aliarcobacter thereius LMG 24486 TaxID=1032240 RepID=A0A1C7WP57_9BACT|nr:radical SAM/SPASM domain-containing protein [Aliarcobacter thereius]OCL95546.1 molybdenum cofactor biosynthesis protein A [Aliarcobacter thereius LMG 24486]QBF16469.1 radical SAM superfamily protein (SPASM domain) [Aliarcobacter thereius LMG 24486]TLS91539.1 radical SAM/SPASM domain-containing protein [Aliarcobacter thereius]
MKINKFRKVHIELTNICNLKCTFCPPKLHPNKVMDLELFDRLNFELKEFTNELAYHIVGDPLVLGNLNEYLDISKKHNLKVNITTTANNISNRHYETLLNSTIKQINFSLNSYNANSHKKSFQEYLEPILNFVKYAQEKNHEYFINFRIWNLDEEKSAKEFNKKVFDSLNIFFELDLNIDEIYENRPKNIRVARKIFINFDEYFVWPSLKNEVVSKSGFCHGLSSHFGILSNASVVPCCLDLDASINLGNIENNSIKEILNSNRAKDMINGFKKNILVEELCQKCEYRTRFEKDRNE